MQENQDGIERERAQLSALFYLEGLGIRKANIYARLLTDVALAKNMEEIASRCQKRQQTLQTALGKPQKKSKEG